MREFAAPLSVDIPSTGNLTDDVVTNARDFPDAVVFSRNDGGTWTDVTAAEFLAEVQQVCTAATIIGNGKLLASGQVTDLLGSSTAHRVVVDEPDRAAGILERAGMPVTVTDGVLRVDSDQAGAITRVLAESGLWLTELTPLRPDLETFFLALTDAERLGANS